MKTIHKQSICLGHQLLYVQPGSKFIAAALQGNNLCVWYSVPDDSVDASESRNVYVVGTGHDTSGVPINCHVGTVIDGAFVWHVFAE